MLSVLTLPVGILQTNCYLSFCTATREAVVIDPGDDAEVILARIQKESLNVKYLFVTHVHFDHVLALEDLRAALHVPVVCHADDAGTFAEEITRRYLPRKYREMIFATPEVIIHDGDVLTTGSVHHQWISTPGHSKGSCCIRTYADDEIRNVLFAGDTILEHDCGRCDLPGGDPAQMVQSLCRIADMPLPDETPIFSGHGNPSTLGFERRHNPQIRSALETSTLCS